MYRPEYSKNTNESLAWDLIREYPLGLLICNHEQKIVSNYLPFLLVEKDEDIFLLSHLAKANPQWRELAKEVTSEVVVSFLGPQCYISPNIYKDKMNVPTWNYAAVQVYGAVEVLSDVVSLKEILKESVRYFESKNGTNWSYNLPTQFQDKLEAAIIGIKIKVNRLEAKFKLSQNRGPEDYESVLNVMKNSGKEKDQEIFNWMIKSKP